MSGVYLLFWFLLLIANCNITGWLLLSLMFLSLSIFILIVQPYKESYMNVLDGLLLALLGLVTLLLVIFQYLHNNYYNRWKWSTGSYTSHNLQYSTVYFAVECHLQTNERKRVVQSDCKASKLECSHISLHSHHTNSNIMLW